MAERVRTSKKERTPKRIRVKGVFDTKTGEITFVIPANKKEDSGKC